MESGSPHQQLCDHIVVPGLWAACPSHLTLWRLRSWVMGTCPVTFNRSAVEGPPMPRYRPIKRCMQELWEVSSRAAWELVRAHDSAAPYVRRESTRRV